MGATIPPMPTLGELLDPAWKKHFAWWPVKVNGKTRWLTTVYRKQDWFQPGGVNFDTYKYGDIFDVLKDN